VSLILGTDPFQVIGPFGTLNNTDSSFIIPSEKAQDLLNVDITPGGKSVKKRKGFGLSQTLTITTSPVHGVHNFYDSSGNDVSLFFHDRYMSSSIAGNAATVLMSTGTAGASYQCVDSQGFGYCVSSARAGLIKTNGVTFSFLPITSSGTLVAVTPERLATAGFSANPNRIDFSKANDFATWTVGGAPTDPVQITVAAPGSRVTHLTYAHSRLYWFKDSSFGYISFGPTLGDWQVRTVSPNLGTLYNTSVYWEEILYFKGQDSHIYAYDGSNIVKLTRDIQDTISASQARIANSWTQTTSADWATGHTTPEGYVDTATVSGIIMLATTTAISPLIDTTQANFEGGTFTQVDATTTVGSLQLAMVGSEALKENLYGVDSSVSGGCSGPYYTAQSFTASSNYKITSVVMRLEKTGSPGNYTIRVLSDNSNVPNAILSTGTLLAASVGASASDITVSLSSSAQIISGTKYWVQMVPDGTCNASNVIRWNADTTGSPYANPIAFEGSILFTARYNLKTNGRVHATSGNTFSRALDVGFTTATWRWEWSTFTTTYTSNGQTLSFETQTASSTSGAWTSAVSATPGSSPTSTVQRYLRYKASFSTTDSGITPVLDAAQFEMSARRRPQGSFYTAVKNAPNLTAWDSLTADKQDSAGSHTFYIRSSTNSFTVASSTPAWTAVSLGAIPSVSTGTYFQIRDDLATVNHSTQNPFVESITQNWFEGSAADQSYGIYHNNGIWWSVTSGAGATTNNRVLLYDLLNQGWTLYDLASNGFFVRNQSLYFGSASGGYVYKFGDSDNDNGSAINAYWKSKDFFGDSPFTDKEFTALSLSAGSVTSSSMTVTYTVNGSSSTSYTMNLSNTANTFMKNNKNLPAGRIGNALNVQFGNNAADQPFEVFSVMFGYRPKPWIVTP
jgi:hypothetical protein